MVKDLSFEVVGLEEYQSEQLEGTLCHLTNTQDDLTTDFYVDETAFHALTEGSGEVGNGCISFNVKDTLVNTEVCFGEKVTNP